MANHEKVILLEREMEELKRQKEALELQQKAIEAKLVGLRRAWQLEKGYAFEDIQQIDPGLKWTVQPNDDRFGSYIVALGRTENPP